MASLSRPPISANVARILRQESGYGCAKCGNPIIEYHHIIRWEIDHHFRPEGMVAFCPSCHTEADAMTEADEREYKANPVNIKRGTADGYLRINQGTLFLKMGRNFVKPINNVLSVDGEPLFSVGLSEKKARKFCYIVQRE